MEGRTADPTEYAESRRETLVSLTSVPQFCVFIVPIIDFVECRLDLVGNHPAAQDGDR